MNRGVSIDRARVRDRVAFIAATTCGAIALVVFVAAVRLVAWA